MHYDFWSRYGAAISLFSAGILAVFALLWILAPDPETPTDRGVEIPAVILHASSTPPLDFSSSSPSKDFSI